MTSESAREFAPAKINLTLHVTGQRGDGYHLLDSLVMFADVGDFLSMAADGKSQLKVEGPESKDVPSDATNSVLRTAAYLGSDASFHLTKNLPSMAGIGGGTADAAAAFRLLQSAGQGSTGLPSETAMLGADVPVCIRSETTHMRGIGEDLTFHPTLPALPAVLVNPRAKVSTPEVFQVLTSKNNSPLSEIPTGDVTAAQLISWLACQRNDLQAAAASLFPKINDALNVIAHSKACQLTRMSGSGATCFGLFEASAQAEKAAFDIQSDHPDWWVKSCVLGG